MRNQMIIERYKAVRFYIIYIAALVLVVAGFLHGLIKIPKDLNTSAVFSNLVCDTSFIFILSLVAAWFAGNDFLNRTIHNEIKAGYSRISVIITRTITTVFMGLLLHLAYIAASLLGFVIKAGFDSSVFTVVNLSWLLVVMLQICANICIVMFIVFALKKVTSGIAVTVIFAIVSCNILRNFISDSVFRLTPFSLAQTSDSQTLILSAAVAAVMIAVSMLATHLVFRRAEIK
ncbi:MAG: ABC transporter permease [Oscillospiraceae bacterium]|nr:ABC transporter permease [Oscillospiraceae bacterium]